MVTTLPQKLIKSPFPLHTHDISKQFTGTTSHLKPPEQPKSMARAQITKRGNLAHGSQFPAEARRWLGVVPTSAGLPDTGARGKGSLAAGPRARERGQGLRLEGSRGEGSALRAGRERPCGLHGTPGREDCYPTLAETTSGFPRTVDFPPTHRPVTFPPPAPSFHKGPDSG